MSMWTDKHKRKHFVIIASVVPVAAGLIFYPGGKVEYTAYQPLMAACAERDILCVLVEMPFNLAVFDINAADGIQEQYPEVGHWYIGGHSLGGSMAASYLSKHTEKFDHTEPDYELVGKRTSLAEDYELNMEMPVMDGCTAIRKIRSLSRADAKSISIIALTANFRKID